MSKNINYKVDFLEKSVVCVNLGEDLPYETETEGITLMNTYKVLAVSSSFSQITGKELSLITLINDDGYSQRYNSELFIDLEDWRTNQLNKIGI